LKESLEASDIERSLMNWDSVKSIVCLVDALQTDNLWLLLNRLHTYASDSRTVHIFGYTKNIPPFEDYGIQWFNNKKLNWMGIPNASVIKSLNIHHNDLLINAGNKNTLPLHYLSALSTAQIRIAPFYEKYLNYYDFMFREVDNSEALLNHIEHYLSRTNTKQYAQV